MRSEDLSYAVVDELGGDLNYVRLASGVPEDRRYLTGIEIGLFIGTQVLTGFWIGFLQGIGSSIGEEVSKRAVAAANERLQALRNRLQGTSTDDAKAVVAAARAGQAELDTIVATEIAAIVADGSPVQQVAAATAEEQAEIRIYLVQIGVPEEKAAAHAERITKRLQQELTAA